MVTEDSTEVSERVDYKQLCKQTLWSGPVWLTAFVVTGSRPRRDGDFGPTLFSSTEYLSTKVRETLKLSRRHFMLAFPFHLSPICTYWNIKYPSGVPKCERLRALIELSTGRNVLITTWRLFLLCISLLRSLASYPVCFLDGMGCPLLRGLDGALSQLGVPRWTPSPRHLVSSTSNAAH